MNSNWFGTPGGIASFCVLPSRDVDPVFIEGDGTLILALVVNKDPWLSIHAFENLRWEP